MADELSLQIEARTETGSNAARKMRKRGRIPGIVYGHGAPEAISVDLADFRHKVKPEHYGSTVIRLQQGAADAGVAVVKSVHADTVHGGILSIDLQRVSAADVLHLSVPVAAQGEPAGRRAGGLLDLVAHALNIRCRADAVPAEIAADVSPLQVGDVLHAGQLALPDGVELLDAPDLVIAVLLAPTVVAAAPPAPVEPGAAALEPAGEKPADEAGAEG